MEVHRFIPKAKAITRVDEIVRRSARKTVLHVGLGGYVDNPDITAQYISIDLTQTVHGRVTTVADGVTGLDINPRVIEAMKRTIPGDYIVGDITEPELAEKIGRQFDLVLFPDVIEHLDCFRTALNNIKNLLRPNGEVIITAPNAYCLERFGKMLFRYEAVHEEHTSYFSYATMKRLLEMNGFEITTFYFVNENRVAFASLFDRIAHYTMVWVARILPQYSAGIFVVAQPVTNYNVSGHTEMGKGALSDEVKR